MRGIIENHFSPDLMCSQKMLLTAGHTLIIRPHQNYNSAFALHSAKAAKRARPKKTSIRHVGQFAVTLFSTAAIQLYLSVYTRLHCYVQPPKAAKNG